MELVCQHCGDGINPKRAELGYRYCLPCGETRAKQVKHCTAPLNKSNYYYISNMDILKQLNPKRTT